MENPFQILESRLQIIEAILLDIKHGELNRIDNTEKLFGIDEAKTFTGLSKQTIYNKVANREIPHQRKNGRLYFSSSELTEWIKSGKRKTNQEIKEDAQSYLKKKGVSNG